MYIYFWIHPCNCFLPFHPHIQTLFILRKSWNTWMWSNETNIANVYVVAKQQQASASSRGGCSGVMDSTVAFWRKCENVMKWFYAPYITFGEFVKVSIRLCSEPSVGCFCQKLWWWSWLCSFHVFPPPHRIPARGTIKVHSGYSSPRPGLTALSPTADMFYCNPQSLSLPPSVCVHVLHIM